MADTIGKPEWEPGIRMKAVVVTVVTLESTVASRAIARVVVALQWLFRGCWSGEPLTESTLPGSSPVCLLLYGTHSPALKNSLTAHKNKGHGFYKRETLFNVN